VPGTGSGEYGSNAEIGCPGATKSMVGVRMKTWVGTGAPGEFGFVPWLGWGYC
jgi:hypothetical protein